MCLDLADDDFFRASAPISYDVTARLVSFELFVAGCLAVRLSCRCARCDEWVDAVFRVPDFWRCCKLSRKNEIVDLTDDMREDILLALPINFICSASCAGLCPVCGANLNKRRCSCGEPGGNDAWSPLERLYPGR